MPQLSSRGPSSCWPTTRVKGNNSVRALAKLSCNTIGTISEIGCARSWTRYIQAGASAGAFHMPDKNNDVVDKVVNGSRLVSIVITNFNYARFLTDLIDNTLDQTCNATEDVVLDDRS